MGQSALAAEQGCEAYFITNQFINGKLELRLMDWQKQTQSRLDLWKEALSLLKAQQSLGGRDGAHREAKSTKLCLTDMGNL